jgi:hypothetical protein
LPHRLPPAQGRLSHRSWGKYLQMMRAPLPCHEEWWRAWWLCFPWLTRGRVLPRALRRCRDLSWGRRGATSPTIIDVDPIRTVPGGAEGVVGDQPRIDLAPGGPETSGAQVPPSSSSSPRLSRRSINWNRTPWQEDWFEDNEDMQALRTSIVTINNALTVSCPR